ncbi:MAG: hypothetical protein LBL21_01020 [Rickettsiales bacterium]|jgi:hypothetical protein|nr:hypothetical protein [Rickettsiales bacterium]
MANSEKEILINAVENVDQQIGDVENSVFDPFAVSDNGGCAAALKKLRTHRASLERKLEEQKVI